MTAVNIIHEDSLINSHIFEYKILRLIGEGGMGKVYAAVHPVLGHEVAIKVLDPMLARNKDIRERFLQEARIQITLRHQSIVQVQSASTEGDHLALIMELVEGNLWTKS